MEFTIEFSPGKFIKIVGGTSSVIYEDRILGDERTDNTLSRLATKGRFFTAADTFVLGGIKYSTWAEAFRAIKAKF